MKKILLVEDNPLLVESYSRAINSAGFEVEVISDGQEVIPAVEKNKPDLIVMDVVLPNKDGWEVLTTLKNGHDGLKDTKVIIVSDLCQAYDVEKGLEMGAAKYLIRDHYTPEEIVEEIKKILN
ncbi:MAG: response regulator [Candidatus Paceibacterota bacterium]|jgi:DNA-binding response OmpR family regulator|nr:response regulator [Candidatus Paceibacterota bacterium]